MKLDSTATSFGRHETFPLRYGWLTKGYEAIRKDPALFADPERAMVFLGVGRNMVNAIQYWMEATRIAIFKGGQGQLTRLGAILLGNEGDPYLEDDATLWILHWLIASNARAATGFFWFFNRFSMPRFRDDEALQALLELAGKELPAMRSHATLKSDISTLLRMYAATEGRTDEHLDSPFAQLGLVEADPNSGFRSLRAPRPFLPPIALHFALAERFAVQPDRPAFPIRAALYGDDGWAAIGAIFRLSEEGLVHALERVLERYPGRYELRDTAGVHQIYRRDDVPDPLDVLRGHYGRRAP